MHKTVRIAALTALVAPIAILISPLPASAEVTARDITQFACAPDASSPFADVGDSVHANAIACIVGYGLASGTTATTYAPSRPVTRGQMATFLANFVDYVGIPLGGGAAPPPDEPVGPRVYSDVDGNTHEDAIYYVTDLGIAEGTTATTFSPNVAVTRGQMATFLVRTMDFLGFSAPEAPDAFTDDQGGAHEATTNAIAALGIAQGTSPGVYQPRSAVARGAMATFLARTLDLGIEVGFAYPNVASDALAALSGASVAPGPGASGVGTAYLATTDIDDVLCFQIDGVGGATQIHVHEGAPGLNGPVVATIPLPSGDAAVGCTKSAAAAALASSPDDFYVDVHTAAFPDGAVRGQLGSIVSSASAAMDANEVVPGPGSPDVFGFANVVTTSQPNVLCVQVFALAFDDTINAVHLHEGALHASGSLVLDIPVTPSDEVFVAHCTTSASAASMASSPSSFYVDVHTAAFPDGAARGQLADDGF